VAALAGSPHFGKLRLLNLLRTGTTDAGAAAIARSPHLACSEGLYLDNNKITDSAVAALAGSPSSACLTDLGMSMTEVGNEGLAALIQAPTLGSLHSLRISSRITDPGMRVLATAPAASRLRKLDLSHNSQLGVAGAEVLARSEHLTKLQELGIHDTRIGPRGALALIHSTHFPALHRLHIGTESGRWDGAVWRALEQRFGM
jgi:hypothetical protein